MLQIYDDLSVANYTELISIYSTGKVKPKDIDVYVKDASDDPNNTVVGGAYYRWEKYLNKWVFRGSIKHGMVKENENIQFINAVKPVSECVNLVDGVAYLTRAVEGDTPFQVILSGRNCNEVNNESYKVLIHDDFIVEGKKITLKIPYDHYEWVDEVVTLRVTYSPIFSDTVSLLLHFDDTPTEGSVQAVTSDGIFKELERRKPNFDETPVEGSANLLTSGSIKTALDNNKTILNFDSQPTLNSDNLLTSGSIKTALDKLQPTINYDLVPTQGSDNLLTSDSLNTVLSNFQPTITFDQQPTLGSDNLLTSGSIKSALDSIQSTLTFDIEPTAGSNKLLTSGSVKSALSNFQPLISYDTVPTSGSSKLLTSDSIKTAIDSVKVGIDDIKTDVNDVKVDINNIETDVSNVKTNINSIENSVNNVKTDVSDIKTDMSSIKTDINNVETGLSNIETNVENNKTDIDNFKIDLDGIKDDIDNFQPTITFDSQPTIGSSNPVTSDGIFKALSTTSSTNSGLPTPTADNNGKIIGVSGGVYTFVENNSGIKIYEDVVIGTDFTSTLTTNSTIISVEPFAYVNTTNTNVHYAPISLQFYSDTLIIEFLNLNNTFIGSSVRVYMFIQN
jgi:archaellum component FlaC